MSQQINLYDARLRPRHELLVARNLGKWAGALLLLMVALSLWAHFDAKRKTEAASALQQQLTEQQEQLTALSKAVSDRRVSPPLAAELDQVKATLAARKEVAAVVDSGRVGNTAGFSSFMTGFARLAQGDLWLTGFRVAAGGEEIEIRGRLFDSSKLPVYVQRLSGEPVFKGRRFAALEMKGVDPEVEKAAQPAPAIAAEPSRAAGQGAAAPRLPRFVEFVLRSENVGSVDNVDGDGSREGAKR